MQTLPRRLSHCILEGEAFDHGMEYISFLDYDGNRRDYCPQCWEKADKPTEGHFWRGKIPYKKEKIYRPDEKAMELFHKASDPKQKFVLALYLQRKQQLIRLTQTLYENPETGEVFSIEKVFLLPEEGESLAQAINACIN